VPPTRERPPPPRARARSQNRLREPKHPKTRRWRRRRRALLFTRENVGAVRAKERFEPRTPGGEVRRWVRRPLRMLEGGGRGRREGVAPLRGRGEISRVARRTEGGSGREFARGAEKSRTCGLYPRMIPRLSRAEFNVLSGSAPENRGRQAGEQPPDLSATRTHIHTHTYTRARVQRTRTRRTRAHTFPRDRTRPLAPPLRTPRGYTGCPVPTRRLLFHSPKGHGRDFSGRQVRQKSCSVSRLARIKSWTRSATKEALAS